ncbi:MAG: TonB-dependent receptor [Balneolaceae bacterium]|nr:TonB-dependent receptor [Balneolaceae bacterium]
MHPHLSSITQQLPGIWVNNRENQALGERITIRGLGWRAAFGVRGIQIILNGIPLTVADGQSVTNVVDPAFITRAELLRGPAGSYWGNSSGGVLYLSTDPGNTNQPFYLRAQTGSYGEKKVQARYSQYTGKHKITAFTSYQYEDGYRDYSSSRLLRSGIQGSYQLSQQSHIEYTGALLAMPQAQHPSGLTAEQAANDPRQANDSFVASDAGKQVTQGQVGLSYHRETAAGLLNVSGYGIYRDLTNPLPFGIITVDRLAGGFRGTLEKTFDNLRINGGAEIKFQHDGREEFENDSGNRGSITLNQTENVRNEAIFFTSVYPLNKIKLLGSLRYDRITFSSDSASNVNTGERTFQSVSPSFGLSYDAGRAIIYSNVSTSFEAPTTTELVNRPDGGNGFNPNLKPERTTGLEAGARGAISQGLINYDLAFYHLWINDLLFPYQLETNGPVFYRNQGKTRHYGIEFSSTIYPTSNISFDATYTLTQAKFEQAQTLDNISLSGNRVPGIPKHRVAGTLAWQPASFWFQLNANYASSYTVNNLNTVFNDEYLTVDTKLSYTKSFDQSGVSLTPFINLNNIFDADYNGSTVVNAFGGRYFEPAPGRNWQAGVSMRF